MTLFHRLVVLVLGVLWPMFFVSVAIYWESVGQITKWSVGDVIALVSIAGAPVVLYLAIRWVVKGVCHGQKV